MSRFEAVLLDMGGVLLEMGNVEGVPRGPSHWRGREALARLLARRGRRLAGEEVERLLFEPWRAEHARRYELGREARWEPHLRRLRRASGSRVRNLTLLAAWFRPYGERVAARPGAAEAVRELRRMGLALALVSNVPLPGLLYERLLARHGLREPLAHVLFSYEAGSRKPSPVMLRRALAALGVEPERAVMVGDRRQVDIAAGRAAGTATIWLAGPHDSGPQPDRTIGSVTDLAPVLAAWSG